MAGLYRQELTFLHASDDPKSKELEAIVQEIRGDLADGQLNLADDWEDWRDTLIFREELRAIGESLTMSRGATRAVMGYGGYCQELEVDGANSVKRWSGVLLNFLVNLESSKKDFRRVRLERLFIHLADLINFLDKGSFPNRLDPLVAEVRAKIAAQQP